MPDTTPAGWPGHLLDGTAPGVFNELFATAVRPADDGLVEVDGYIRPYRLCDWRTRTVDPAAVTVLGRP
jgi:hypothetical protein